MSICFVNPPFKAEFGKFSRESRSPAITKSGALCYPSWLIYAALYSQKHGHKVHFLDTPAKQLSEKQLSGTVQKENSERTLLVFDTSTPSTKDDMAFVERLKELYPSSFVILAGTHPSACPGEMLDYPFAVGTIATGEYDYIISELTDSLQADTELQTIHRLCVRTEKGIICIKEMPLMKDLDGLPFASRSIKEYLGEKDCSFAAATYSSIQIFTGRGCPFRYSFCVYPRTMHGHTFRARSAENVAVEPEYIAVNLPDAKKVMIEDDTLTVNKKRVLDVCRLPTEKKLYERLKWLCSARVNLDLETMCITKGAGRHLTISGIESGSQQIPDNIEKGTKVEQFYEYVANAKKAGLLIHACYMVGNEGETKDTTNETLQLTLRLNVGTAQFFPLVPCPGIETYQRTKDDNCIETGYAKYYLPDGTRSTVLFTPEPTAEDMITFCNVARRGYYLRIDYILHCLHVGLPNPSSLKCFIEAFGKLKYYLFSSR